MLGLLLLGASAAAFGLTAHVTGSLAVAGWACVLSLLAGGAAVQRALTASSRPASTEVNA